jgi:predicted DCC family thiol-disulfide oxidoreductase YuxK
MSRNNTSKILFYDGDCGFCNKSVQFVLKHERSSEIYFSALQSDFAHEFFQQHGLPVPDMSTFYFWSKGKMLQQSTAALIVSEHFRFPFNLIQVGWIVPRFIRDALYRFIAKRRHRLAKGFCVLPSIEQKARFLN